MRISTIIGDAIYKLTKWLITIALAAIVVLVVWQVYTRYILNATAVWATEAATLIMIWMLFLGCGIGLRDGELISLSIVIDRLPPRRQAVVKLVRTLCMIIFLLTLVILNRRMLVLSSTTPMPVLQISKFWVHFSLTTGFSIMILYSLLQLAREIGSFVKLVSKEQDDT